MNLREIVAEYLIKNGYDGLFSDSECACKNEDLFPCDNPAYDCQAGYLTPCDCGGHDWHISETKEGRE
jgi:hypothetical protein